jgi:hypothetical protein
MLRLDKFKTWQCKVIAHIISTGKSYPQCLYKENERTHKWLLANNLIELYNYENCARYHFAPKLHMLRDSVSVFLAGELDLIGVVNEIKETK